MNTRHVLSNSHLLLFSSVFLLISLLSSLTTPLLSHSNVAVHLLGWIRTLLRCYRAEQPQLYLLTQVHVPHQILPTAGGQPAMSP